MSLIDYNVHFYFSNQVLGISDGIDHVGGVQPHLLACLVFAWIIVYGVIWKGLHNSGKVEDIA